MITTPTKNRLSEINANQLRESVEPLGYNRSNVEIGIVHLGPGAFHRAHQAVYTDKLLKQGERKWGICAVSINSTDVKDALEPQNNLYTLAILDRDISYHLIGSIKEVLVASQDPTSVIARLSQESVKTVTLTITEKGYCLTAERKLDFSHPAIAHDTTTLQQPRSAVGFLVAGLLNRWKSSIEPFTVLSCDNLTDNGKLLRGAVLEFAEVIDENLAQWIAENVKFPCSMVDSITPATNDDIRAHVSEKIGLQDMWPIQREQFTQWVIEDLYGAQLPPWQNAGATLSNNVRGYENAKLRILNGTHTSLAFLGILAGIESVREAILQPDIRAFIESELADEIIPTLELVEGLNTVEYSQSIIKRFENPAICHLLSQIAWDSSHKIPFRILGTISDNLAAERRSPKLCFVVAAWMRFLILRVKIGIPIVDGLSKDIAKIVNSCTGEPEDIQHFLQLTSVFPDKLRSNADFIEDVTLAYMEIGSQTNEGFLNVIRKSR